MQLVFGSNQPLLDDFKRSLSYPRFSRYRKAAADNDMLAVELYQWNARLSQSIYIYIQGWEVCLRNKLADFMSWKYGQSWPYDKRRALRQLTDLDKRRIWEAIERQERSRKISPVPIPAIIADLSCGFWVSLLSSSYDVPFVWRYNIGRIFPHDQNLDAALARSVCAPLLDLRNRVAHHEPIYHLKLHDLHEDLRRIVAAMCPATFAYCEATCTFKSVLATEPKAS